MAEKEKLYDKIMKQVVGELRWKKVQKYVDELKKPKE